MTGMTSLPDEPTPLTVEDVIAALTKQHRQALDTMAEVSAEFGGARSSGFHALRLALACHETAEQLAVHPVAAALAAAGTDTRDRIAQENDAAALIEALEHVDVDSDEFNARFQSLADAVRTHASGEERDEWPLLESIGNHQVLEQMFAVIKLVPDLMRSSTAPTISSSYTEMLAWARGEFETRAPVPDHPAEGPDLRDAAAPAGSDAAPPPEKPQRTQGHSLLVTACALALIAGGYALGRRRSNPMTPAKRNDQPAPTRRQRR